MAPLNRRKRPSLAIILGIIALLLSALYVAGLILDWPAWVHGSNWVWVRRVPEMGWRFLLMPAALAGGLALGTIALGGRAENSDEWSRRSLGLFLGGLVIVTPLLQIAIAAQHRTQPLSLMTTGSTGFWLEGVRIEDPALFIREHTTHMPSYADVHVRTQPPGWPLVYWATSQAFASMPGMADVVGRWIHRYDCTTPELSGLDPAKVAAGSVRIVILLLSGLGVLPLYAIGHRFYPPATARLATVGYAYLPGLLVFSGRFDVVYALLTLAGLWLALRAVLDGDRLAAGILALGLAAASFLSFTTLAVGAFVLAIPAVCGVTRRDGEALRHLIWTAVAIMVAVLLLWIGLWLAMDVNGIAMWRTSQEIHRVYRLNYPAWFLFNLYDLAVFMGFVPFIGAIGALIIIAGRRDEGSGSNHGLVLGWASAVLLLNLSATVRAETGRLWLFVMPLGLLIGLAFFTRESGHDRRWRIGLMALLGVFLTQALVTGYLLGGRAGNPNTPAPTRRVPDGVSAVDVQLGEAVALKGYQWEWVTDGLDLTLYWQALDFPRVEYSAFVHALDSAGEIVGQSDGPPSAVPMWCWVPGEVVADERTLNVSEEAVEIGVGLYDPLTGVRLPVSPPAPDNRILLPLHEK